MPEQRGLQERAERVARELGGLFPERLTTWVEIGEKLLLTGTPGVARHRVLTKVNEAFGYGAEEEPTQILPSVAVIDAVPWQDKRVERPPATSGPSLDLEITR